MKKKNQIKDWRDIYKLPLKDSYIDSNFRSGQIYDSAGNFVFQFNFTLKTEAQENLLNAINGIKPLSNLNLNFKHIDSLIMLGNSKVLKIRGWGNLTGIGGHKLSPELAATVQDTFADYIVEQLNRRT